ncbi:MAG: ExbD/TolR family protein [Bdellovibrionales bacterium]
MSERLRGSSDRVITTPGYHIRPQYDLVHTRHILDEKKNKKKTFQLMLAPMVDMFSILVIYLIMNFSTDGDIFFVSKGVKIPKSSTGQVMETHPIISVVRDAIVFDSVGSKGTITEPNDERVPRLREALRKIKQIETSLKGDDGFKGQVNLQADEATRAEEIKKVMRVLIDEGWTGINFIVVPDKK